MTATTVDEETPLLPEQQQKKPTPLPWAQFSIILVLQLAEPLTSQVIYPFAPQVCCIRRPAVIATYVRSQLIRDVGITHGDETRVGYYVGVMVRPSARRLPRARLRGRFTAINILRDAGLDCPALESHVRPHRPQTYHHDRSPRSLSFHVLFRSIHHILGCCAQVRFPSTARCLPRIPTPVHSQP